MTKKSTFRKPATDAVIEYLQRHKTATFAELIAALPQYEKHTLQIAREALRKRNQIVRLRENNKDVKRGKPAQIVFTLGEGRSKKERLAAARNPNNNPVNGLGGSVSADQKEWIAYLEECGYRCFVARGAEDAKRQIIEIEVDCSPP